MNTDFDNAVQKAVDQRDAEKDQAKANVTTGTYIWAIVAALVSPLIGGCYGIYQLANGRTKKGWIYVGFAAAVFVISLALLSG
jgi:hypothetical protein